MALTSPLYTIHGIWWCLKNPLDGTATLNLASNPRVSTFPYYICFIRSSSYRRSTYRGGMGPIGVIWAPKGVISHPNFQVIMVRREPNPSHYIISLFYGLFFTEWPTRRRTQKNLKKIPLIYIIAEFPNSFPVIL